jgi:hypothetical protein
LRPLLKKGTMQNDRKKKYSSLLVAELKFSVHLHPQLKKPQVLSLFGGCKPKGL